MNYSFKLNITTQAKTIKIRILVENETSMLVIYYSRKVIGKRFYITKIKIFWIREIK